MSEPTSAARGMPRLRTDLGDRDLYDSVSQCNRCGYCEQVCPTYVLTGKEAFSGRGRNQLARLLLEGGLKDPATAEEALSTCLLCGACTSICYAHVATVDHVLEARRALRKGELHRLAAWLMDSIADRPGLFRLLLKTVHLMKRLGISRLAAASGVLRLAGLGIIEEADRSVEEAPLRLLEEELRDDPELSGEGAANWVYFVPCGSNFLFTRVGAATVSNLKRLWGPGRFLSNGCCGLLHYNYGDVEKARELARRVIALVEARAPASVPIVADCSSCTAHLKTYPQFFLGDAGWLARAEACSARVRDAVQMVPPDLLGSLPLAAGERVTYHDSCRCRNGQGVTMEPRAAMRALAGEAYRELPEAEWCCGGAGAFAFKHPELSGEIVRRKVSRIAELQARTVATSSTSCLIQLASGMKEYYPQCRVAHLSELVAESLGAGPKP